MQDPRQEDPAKREKEGRVKAEMKELVSLHFMPKSDDPQERQIQRRILEQEFPKYDPRRHDAFVLWHNAAVERMHEADYAAKKKEG